MFLFISSPFRGTVEGWHAFFTGLTEGKRSSSWLPLSSSNREMGIPSEMGDAWANKEKSFVVASPDERSESSVREAVQAAFKTAVISGAVAAVPTLIGCRVIPWAKANLNHTAQALIISAASIAGFFITADRTILQNARENTMGKYDKTT
uniref:Early nodulin-93 isoform X1 n=1 Tax=Elaeis guineensis var. tenera TaxID=51953 RepID=A0A6I9R0T2_ELAGV|nr:early nodulin-93 isoform X1 [Elaeis guineensis]